MLSKTTILPHPKPVSHNTSHWCHRPASGIARPQHKRSVRRHSRHVLQRAAASSALSKDSLLSEWITVEDQGEMGRGLVAVADVEPGTVLISVSITDLFKSQEEQPDRHWAADMALSLLRERHAHENGGNNKWGPWLELLPTTVTTPVEFDEEDIREIQWEGMMYDVEQLKASVEAAYEELKSELQLLGYGRDEYMWAVQLMHSRCFYDATIGRHLTAPGMDMANHTFTPNANVQLTKSPDACQGADAVEEVCPPTEMRPAHFELVAGSDGLRAGEAVSISYGPWPSEVFFLLFGFVPDPNPHEYTVVFEDATALVSQYQLCLAQLNQDTLTEEQWQAIAEHLEGESTNPTGQGGTSIDFNALVVTAAGYDVRMSECVAAVAAAVKDKGLEHTPLPTVELVVHGCATVLNSLETSFWQDQALLQGGTLSERRRLAVAYRAAKKAVLVNAVLKLGGKARMSQLLRER